MRLIRIYGFLLNKEFGIVHKSKKEAFKAQVFSRFYSCVLMHPKKLLFQSKLICVGRISVGAQTFNCEIEFGSLGNF